MNRYIVFLILILFFYCQFPFEVHDDNTVKSNYDKNSKIQIKGTFDLDSLLPQQSYDQVIIDVKNVNSLENKKLTVDAAGKFSTTLNRQKGSIINLYAFIDIDNDQEYDSPAEYSSSIIYINGDISQTSVTVTFDYVDFSGEVDKDNLPDGADNTNIKVSLKNTWTLENQVISVSDDYSFSTTMKSLTGSVVLIYAFVDIDGDNKYEDYYEAATATDQLTGDENHSLLELSFALISLSGSVDTASLPEVNDYTDVKISVENTWTTEKQVISIASDGSFSTNLKTLTDSNVNLFAFIDSDGDSTYDNSYEKSTATAQLDGGIDHNALSLSFDTVDIKGSVDLTTLPSDKDYTSVKVKLSNSWTQETTVTTVDNNGDYSAVLTKMSGSTVSVYAFIDSDDDGTDDNPDEISTSVTELDGNTSHEDIDPGFELIDIQGNIDLDNLPSGLNKNNIKIKAYNNVTDVSSIIDPDSSGDFSTYFESLDNSYINLYAFEDDDSDNVFDQPDEAGFVLLQTTGNESLTDIDIDNVYYFSGEITPHADWPDVDLLVHVNVSTYNLEFHQKLNSSNEYMFYICAGHIFYANIGTSSDGTAANFSELYNSQIYGNQGANNGVSADSANVDFTIRKVSGEVSGLGDYTNYPLYILAGAASWSSHFIKIQDFITASSHIYTIYTRNASLKSWALVDTNFNGTIQPDEPFSPTSLDWGAGTDIDTTAVSYTIF